MTRVLGKTVSAPLVYSPNILEAIPRSINRQQLDFGGLDQFFGADVWHLYELSWLEDKNQPVSFCGVLIIPSDSPATVESKSLKLYLNSLNFHRFEDTQAAVACITRDLSSLTGATITLELIQARDLASITTEPVGDLLDAFGSQCSDRTRGHQSSVIEVCEERAEKRWVSHLLRSLCPVTGQPDWATIVIDYEGRAFDCESLSAYVQSYREHQEYHEQCVERIFADLYRAAEPTRLMVTAFYQRRGGIDITPWRSMLPIHIPSVRMGRQ